MGILLSLDLENGSGPRDLLIKRKALMIQDATMGKLLLGPKSGKVLHYFSGVIDDLDSLFELHRRDTLYTFGTRTSVLKCRDGS